MFDRNIYQLRRSRLREQVGSGILLFAGNVESSMNYKDNHFPFRQDSHFLYFFGIDRPGLWALIDIDENREVIYGDDLTVVDIVWTGPREAIHEQAQKCGVSVIKAANELAADLHIYHSAHRQIHFLPPYRPENALKLSHLLHIPAESLPLLASVAFIKAVVAQRSVKSGEEIHEIEKAVSLTADMQLLTIQHAIEGKTEAELAGEIIGYASGKGGGVSFPPIMTVHGEILHNHFSHTSLKQGQLLLCDCGAESLMHYAGDLTRTMPVSKTFSPVQKEVYRIVLEAFDYGVSQLRPGKLFRDVHLGVCAKLAEGLIGMGIMKGNPQDIVQEGAHTLFFPCGLGHMMGLDVHDMEDLGEKYVGYTETLEQSREFGLKSLRLGRELEPGFVLTVEPGLYFNPWLADKRRAEKKYLSFVNYEKLDAFRDFGGIRIEDDFLITEDGARKLGKDLGSTAEEVEEMRRAASW